MPKFTIRKRSREMCIGHRLIGYEGQCRNVHGHGIIVELELQSHQDTATGLSVDFDKVKEFLNALDADWDHAFLYNMHDRDMAVFLERVSSKRYAFRENPTMENLAKHTYYRAITQFGQTVAAVRVYEKGGQDNVAEFRKDPF